MHGMIWPPTRAAFATVDLHIYLPRVIQTLGTRSRDCQATFVAQLAIDSNTICLCDLRDNQSWFLSEYCLSNPTRGNKRADSAVSGNPKEPFSGHNFGCLQVHVVGPEGVIHQTVLSCQIEHGHRQLYAVHLA